MLPSKHKATMTAIALKHYRTPVILNTTLTTDQQLQARSFILAEFPSDAVRRESRRLRFSTRIWKEVRGDGLPAWGCEEGKSNCWDLDVDVDIDGIILAAYSKSLFQHYTNIALLRTQFAISTSRRIL